MKTERPITIAITAMGGQGGGVLADWIVGLGQNNGYLAQSTSVPGVAQRTGATIYYVEFFPKEAAKKAKRDPILAMMPVPGDVDIVIASEMMEAGRALMRGFVTGRTTLIASTHRVYTISEKEPLGDGRQDPDAVMALATKTAGRFIAFDMDAAANATGSFISSVLFGALAGSEALPFPRPAYEKIIKQSGKAVEANLRGFALGFANSTGSAPAKANAPAPAATPPAPVIAPLMARLGDDFSPACHDMLRHGLKRVVDFQDPAYGTLYLDRMAAVYELDKAYSGARRRWRLTRDVARYLALKMAYEDTVRVADLKTRASRFARFAKEVGAKDDQIITITEFMHPRVEELCDILPAPLGRFVLRSSGAKAFLGLFFGKGRRIETTSLRGFLLLSMISALKPLRRSSLRFGIETTRITDWLDSITRTAPVNYALACELAGLQRLLKGYGDTYDRGMKNYATITEALGTFADMKNVHKHVKTLKESALKDEDGLALKAALEKLQNGRTT
ncbi:MAG: indolepyruvate oxidoreductase subunit B [Robiginitomaculum sp.]|nr:MAG: indolepyruvate oxidoreductase subunit B [Robiginitomaculum sp.]